jgi:DNA-binding GntR family transcriptional regulator
VTTSIALARRSLRTVLRAELSDGVVSGRFAPGTRLNESDIARELGVSQTPVREALLSLEGEIAIAAEPRRGFRVLPLARAEATELYTLVGHLERFALELQGAPAAATLDELAAINGRLARKPFRVDATLETDEAFHTLLLQGTPSPHLLETTGRLKRLLRRYEHAYMHSAQNVVTAAAHHLDIIAALRAGKVRRAGKALEQNWLAGIAPMTEWLAQREVGGAGLGKGR